MTLTVIGGASRAAAAFRAYAATAGLNVKSIVRRPIVAQAGEEVAVVADYASVSPALLRGSTAVINFVGVAQGGDALMQQLNSDLPLQLAERAADAGASQFIHVSSLSVYGGAEDIGPDTPTAPSSAYGRSKLKGDLRLHSASNRMCVTLMRVPILYGPTTGGKLHQLASAMHRLRAFPVPGDVPLRSVLHIDNLAAAIQSVIEERTPGVCFAADPELFSIRELAVVIAERTGRRPVLFPLPTSVFSLLRRSRPALYASLYGRSVIDPNSCIRPAAGYPLSLQQGLADLISQP